MGRRAHASQGHQVGAAARHRRRARLLARRGGLRRRREDARGGRRRLRAGARRIRGVAGGHRRRNRARCRHAGDPPRAWRQSHLRAHARCRRTGQGLRGSRRRRRDHVRVRPPHRRHQRGARHRRRLESGRGAADRLPGHAGAAHDAEPVRQASRARRAPGARAHQGCRRLVRHQGAYLCRRDGGGRAVEAAQAAGEVCRRSPGELRHRHSRPRSPHQGENRRDQGRRDHRVRDRRSHRHRPLFGLSAHLGHRGEPGRQPRRRPLHLPELQGPRPRRIPEQERDVPVPRRRPSDRGRGDRGIGRACRGEDRHGPAGIAPAQSVSRRRLSLRVRRRTEIRAALASRVARASRRHDELRRPSRRAEAAARTRHLSRHRLRLVHRGDEPVGRVLRRRRRAHLVAGRRDGEARLDRRDLLPHRRVRAGPGRGSRDRAMRRHRVRRADRARARHHGRHRQHALWRRHLGLARRRHRRRSGVAGRQGAARQRARGRGLDPAGKARSARYPQRHRRRSRHRHGAHRPR